MGNRDKKKKWADSRDIMEAELTELDEWLNEDKRSEKVPRFLAGIAKWVVRRVTEITYLGRG